MGRTTTQNYRGTDRDDDIVLPAGWKLSQTTIDGGKGNDTLNLSNYGNAVTVYLSGGYAKSSSSVAEQPFIGVLTMPIIYLAPRVTGTIRNVENVIGTSGNDVLTIDINSTAPKFADGGPGNDRIAIGSSNGTHIGGTGSDWLISNGSGNTLIGGTYTGLTAVQDGERDFFFLNSAPVILDFELSPDPLVQDHLIFYVPMAKIADFEAATWQPNPGGGVSLFVNGVLEATIANLTVAEASSIQFGYELIAVNGRVEGGPGNDILFDNGIGTQFVLGADSGHDFTAFFDLGEDVLLMEDGVVPMWSDTMLNGAPALVGKWGDNSITLPGLSTSDLPQLLPGGGSIVPEPAGLSWWSSSSDASFYGG